MLMNHEREVLYIACEMERRGIMTYRRAQSMVTDETVVVLLKQLEKEESRHLAFFSELLGDSPDENLGEKRLLLSAYAQKILLPGGVMELMRNDAHQSWEKLIDYAIKGEQDAIEAYAHFAAEVKDERAGAMFLKVRNEEIIHLNELNKLKAKLSSVH